MLKLASTIYLRQGNLLPIKRPGKPSRKDYLDRRVLGGLKKISNKLKIILVELKAFIF